jgi:DNA replication licensing factor MCM5
MTACPAAAAAAERQAFLDMSHDPDIITKIAASIAPKIKGQDDIKMAIACLLFGGSRKVWHLAIRCF